MHEFIANLQLPDALPLSFTQIGQTESPFQIGSLLFTLQGIPTPAYYTFSMLYRISGRIIKAQSDYALFQDGSRLFLVFCSRSLPEFVKDAPGSELSLSSYFSKHKELSSERLSFCFPPEHQYRCRLTLLTAGHGAIFDDWCLYGAPKKISAEDGAYFTRIVHPSIRKYESLPEQTLFIDLPPLGCGMAEIQIL